jgi:hypothetical protein
MPLNFSTLEVIRPIDEGLSRAGGRPSPRARSDDHSENNHSESFRASTRTDPPILMIGKRFSRTMRRTALSDLPRIRQTTGTIRRSGSKQAGRRAAISERGAGEEGIAAGAGPAQRDDRSSSGLYADRATDRQAESATGRLGELRFAGLPARRVSEDQRASRLSAGKPLEASS